MTKVKNENKTGLHNLSTQRLVYGVVTLALAWSLFGLGAQLIQHLIPPTVQPNDLHDTTATLAVIDPVTAQRSDTHDHFAVLLFDAVGTDITIDWSGEQLYAYIELPIRELSRYQSYFVNDSEPLHIELDMQQHVTVCLSEAPLSDPFDPQNLCPEIQARYVPPNTLNSLTVITDHVGVIIRMIVDAGQNFFISLVVVGILALIYKLIISDVQRRSRID